MRNGLRKESSVPQFSSFIERAYDRYIAEDERFEYEIDFNKFTNEWSAAVYDRETDECIYETWDYNFTPQDAWHEMWVGFAEPNMPEHNTRFESAKRHAKDSVSHVDLREKVATIKYPNGMDVLETDMVKALDFMYGLDRDMDESSYTEEEKQKAVDYWVENGERDYYQEWLNEQSYGRYASEGQKFFCVTAFKSIEEVAYGWSDTGETEVVFRKYIDQDDFEMYDWVVLSRGVNGELDFAGAHAESSEMLFSLEDAIFDFEWSPWADFFSEEIVKTGNKFERRVKTSGYILKETYEYGGYAFIHTVDDDEDGYSSGIIKHHMRVSFGWNAKGDRLFATSVLDSNVWDIYYIPYNGWYSSDQPWYHYDEAINIDRVVAGQDDLDDIMSFMLPYCPQVERSIVNKGEFGASNIKDAGLPYRSESTGWYVYFDTMPSSGGELRMSLNNDALNVYTEFMDFDVPKKWNVCWGDVIDINPREYGYDDLDMYHMDAYEVADFVEYLLSESI